MIFRDSELQQRSDEIEESKETSRAGRKVAEHNLRTMTTPFSIEESGWLLSSYSPDTVLHQSCELYQPQTPS